MYSFDQDIANEIAKGPMKYWVTKVWFESSEEDADKIGSMIRDETERHYGDNVARVISISLPLLLEHKAISKYINKTKQYELRSVLPEILSPSEGAYLASGDIMYIEREEIQLAIDVLSFYEKTLTRIKTMKILQLSIPFGIEGKLSQAINDAHTQ